MFLLDTGMLSCYIETGLWMEREFAILYLDIPVSHAVAAGQEKGSRTLELLTQCTRGAARRGRVFGGMEGGVTCLEERLYYLRWLLP